MITIDTDIEITITLDGKNEIDEFRSAMTCGASAIEAWEQEHPSEFTEDRLAWARYLKEITYQLPPED